MQLTFICPSVKVPVLSVQMLVTDPSVSTAASFFTRPWRFRIFFIPSTCIIVTAISNPSGTAATAKMIEILSISKNSCPLMRPTKKVAIVNPTTILVSVLLKSLILIWNGVSASCCSLRLAAICPNSVVVPILPTCIKPLPVTTVVPI